MRRRIWKNDQTSTKKNKNVYFCVAYSRCFSTSIHRVINRLKIFNLSWLRVRMSYHRYNNLAELLKRKYNNQKLEWNNTPIVHNLMH